MANLPTVSTPPAAAAAAVYLGVASATLPAVLPVMVGIFADQFGYGVAGAGLIASLNMAGILVGSLLCPPLSVRFSWSRTVRLGLTIMIGGNMLTMFGGDFAYIGFTRGLSGIGEGIIAGICYAAMGRANRPERVVSIYFGGQAMVGMIGLGSFGWIATTFGWPLIFVLLSVVALPGFWLARTIETAQPDPDIAPHDFSFERGPILALGLIFIFFIGMASLWPFIERIGVDRGLESGAVAGALAASAFGGLAGSVAAGAIAHRLDRIIGLLIGTVTLVAGIGGLVLAAEAWDFAAALWLFAFAWPFQYAFLFGLLASLDSGGRIATLTPAVTGGALAIGPAIGGLLFSHFTLAAVTSFCLACALLALAGSIAMTQTKPQAEGSS